MKTIGMIGGMSWESTATYYKIINETVKQELGGLNSAKIILYSVNFDEIEKCQANGDWQKSAEILTSAAVSLQNAGADFIIICTNTMHKIAHIIQESLAIPILHIATLTASELLCKNITKVGLLGTKYTMEQNFYKEKITKQGIEVIAPSLDDITRVNDIIYNELCLGIISTESKNFYIDVIKRLKADGAQGVILGCTEIGLLITENDSLLPVFDTAQIHAKQAALTAIGQGMALSNNSGQSGSNKEMKLTVNLGKRSYDVIVKRGVLKHIGKLINLNRKVLVVTDDGVPLKYSDTVLENCENGVRCVLPSGEGTKNIESYTHLLRQMMQHGFTRGDAVIAVGGGMVGDLAGFAASSYMRGIDFINCPTTTLSQIDSSIGGKVAVNLDDTKNIVGAFHQPRLVLVDPDTLDTLDERQYAQGLVEALKAGLIADTELFEIFEKQDIKQNIEEIIYKSLDMKRRVVQQDETEKGLRACLNFGHTIGHGIESAAGLGQFYHGECVGLGMLFMIENNVLKERTKGILKKLCMPTEIEYDSDEIYRFVCHDKKAGANTIKIVKVAELGTFRLDSITYDDIRKIIDNGIN